VLELCGKPETDLLLLCRDPLLDAVSAHFSKKSNHLCDQVLGGTGSGRYAQGANSRQPLLLYAPYIVDEVGLGLVRFGYLGQPPGV